jgi:hypothetical protein
MYLGKTIVMFSGEDDGGMATLFWNHPVEDLS